MGEDTSDNDDNIFFLVFKKPVEPSWLHLFSGVAFSLLFSRMHILFLCALNTQSCDGFSYSCLFML